MDDTGRVEVAVRSAALSFVDQIGIKLRRQLRCDPAKEDFVGDVEASAMLGRPMRAPWRIGNPG